jgi:cytochrome P450
MTTVLRYDPADPQTRRDPFPLYQRLQDEDPVHWSESLRCWIITRYDDVRQVALTPDMSSDRLQPFYDALKDERRDILSGVMRYLNLWLVFRAPPEHTRVRKLLNSVFTPALIASMHGRIAETVEHILAPLEPGRPVEFMHEVAVLLPAYVILDMLSVPRAHFPKSRNGRTTCGCSLAPRAASRTSTRGPVMAPTAWPSISAR